MLDNLTMDLLKGLNLTMDGLKVLSRYARPTRLRSARTDQTL